MNYSDDILRIGLFIYNYSYAGGLFQEDDVYMLYLSNYYWNDFSPLLMGEKDVIVEEMCVIFDINNYLERNLRYEPTFCCLTHPNYFANFNTTSNHSAVMFECFRSPLEFDTIQEKLDLFDKQPYEFKFTLNNGIRITNQLWDDCTFYIPRKVFGDFFKLLQTSASHFKCPDIANKLLSSPGSIFHIDSSGILVGKEAIDNFEIYMDRIFGIRNEIICSGHIWDEED